jgi:hypothetical protein
MIRHYASYFTTSKTNPLLFQEGRLEVPSSFFPLYTSLDMEAEPDAAAAVFVSNLISKTSRINIHNKMTG